IESRRQEHQAQQDFIAKVEDMHARMHCPNIRCRENYGFRRACVEKWILHHPEHEHEKVIEEWRALNDQCEQERIDHYRRIYDFAAAMGYCNAVRDLKSILLLASDGTMKSLLDFSAADVDKWLQHTEANIDAWQKRHAWFARAKQALQAQEVEQICQLPMDQLHELAEEARRVWKKQRGES